MLADSQSKFETTAKARLWTLDFILNCFISLGFFIAYYMFLPTLPAHLVSTGLSNSEAGLVIGSLAITSAVTRPIIGILCDRGWAKTGIMAGLAVLAVIAVGLNWTRAVLVLVGLRLIQGAGLAAFTSSSSTVIANVVPASRRGEAMGYAGMPQGLGMTIGPLLGTVLLEGWGFGLVAYSSAAITTCSVLIASRLSKAASRPGDGASEDSKPGKMALFCKHATQPFAVGFSFTVAWGGLGAYLPIFVYDRRIGSPGTFYLVFALALLCTRIFAGRVSDRYGRAVGIYGGMGLMALALLILAVSGSMVTLLASALMSGVGQGFSFPAIMALTVDKAPVAERGQAVSTVAMGMDIGMAVGAMILGPVVDVAGFSAMFASAGGIVIAGLLAYAVLRTVDGRRLTAKTV